MQFIDGHSLAKILDELRGSQRRKPSYLCRTLEVSFKVGGAFPKPPGHSSPEAILRITKALAHALTIKASIIAIY